MVQNNKRREDVIEINLVEVFMLMVQKLWIIALAGILLGGAAFAFSKFVITPQYESTTKVYILNRNDTSTQISYSDTQLASQLTKDYKELITCRYVLEKVINMCSLEDDYEDLQERVTVTNTTDTRIIGITVKDPVPANAQYIANAIRDVASEHIKSVMDIEAVNVVDEANLPTEKSEPSVAKWTAIGLLLGAFIAAGVIFIKFIIDDTIKSSDEVEKYLELSTLALIPVIQEEGKKGKKQKKHRYDTKPEKMEYKAAGQNTSLEEL